MSQNSDVRFHLISNPPAFLNISNSTFSKSFGSKNNLNPLACNKNQEDQDILTEIFRLGMGEYDIEFHYYSGCALHNYKLELKWQFFLWHRNSQDTPFEEIPLRYLGH